MAGCFLIHIRYIHEARPALSKITETQGTNTQRIPKYHAGTLPMRRNIQSTQRDIANNEDIATNAHSIGIVTTIDHANIDGTMLQENWI